MNIATCVIINFKTPDQTKKLVDALRADDFNIILVDNSPATTPSELKTDTGTYRYIANTTNIGFGSAANRGARGTQAEWLLFLNPDVYMSSDAVKNFIKQAKEQQLDATCPKTPDHRYAQPLPSLWWLLSEFTPLKRVKFFHILAQKNPITLWGGCLLIRRKVFESLRGFDEKFFLWFEDSDITKRLLDQGYKIDYLQVDGLRHEGGASFVVMSELEKRRTFFKSAYIYVVAHGTWFDRLVVKLLQLWYGRTSLDTSLKT